ncbi:hypothetical protein OG339_48320 (plasmid) [Streptosporangium sp. NBC_01495]|uniref:hypothetical protein n=1 Tax=Streptosporangium sp. NBC_01495 TaxID=2903899 RepID=UPI002E3145E5|nr:hypothetical protein [Streptosporangium sp. NBC_01495]
MEFHRTLRELWDRTARAEGAPITLRELERRIFEKTGVKVSYTYLGQLYNAINRPEYALKTPSPERRAAIAVALGYDSDVFEKPDKADQTLRELDDFWELRKSGMLAMLRDTQVTMMARGLGELTELPEDARREAFRSGVEAMINAIQQARGDADSTASDAPRADDSR